MINHIITTIGLFYHQLLVMSSVQTRAAWQNRAAAKRKSALDFEMIEALKNLLPKAKFGKGCAKVSYNDKAAIPILFDMSRKIIERSKADKTTTSLQ